MDDLSDLPPSLLAELSPEKKKYDDMTIYDMRQAGMTYKEISKVYGVSRQRVQQIHKKEE